ncbi:MAG: DegT/DnrJ/EryC1/StrS family aminotransferase, partial [Peptococcales bacterium]
LKVLDQRVAKKKYIFEFYKRELGGLEGVQFMPINEWNEPNYWLSCIILSGQVKPIDIMEALEKENIESRPIWKPMHMQPVFEKYDFISYFEANDVSKLVAATKEELLNDDNKPHINKNKSNKHSVSEDVFNKGVCLPSDTKMTDEDLFRVCNVIKELWK